MCTLVALKGFDSRYPLIVAANRDERYARPATAPRVVHERAIAGVDLEKGGTWMGANERGLFVALTNQRSYELAPRGSSSRGHVVLEALQAQDVDGVHALLERLDPSRYEGFNLMYGSAERLAVAYVRPDVATVERVELDAGLWVLPNDIIGSAEFPKVDRALELVRPLLGAPSWDALRAGLENALGDHDKPDASLVPAPPPGSRFDRELLRELQALCIHTPAYGTRSATILALEPGRVAHYLVADGPPCRAPFQEVTALLDEPA